MTLVLHTFRPPWMGSRGRVAEGWVGSLVCGKRERVCRNRAGVSASTNEGRLREEPGLPPRGSGIRRTHPKEVSVEHSAAQLAGSLGACVF